MIRSRVGVLLGVAALVAGVWLSIGPLRLVLLNSGLRVQHPWTHVLGLLLAAVGAIAVAVSMGRWWLRVVPVAVAAVMLLAGYAAVRYRLQASDDGLHLRDWTRLREQVVPWSSVIQVDSKPDALVIHGREGLQIAVDARDLQPEDRAALDRTIARHIGMP